MPHARGAVWARFRVTVVAVVAIAILSVFVYLLTGGTLLQQKVTLYLLIPDATGLERGSAVRVNGTNVGKVGAVALSGSNEPNRIVRLTLSVEREHLRDIPVDSFAEISTDGAVGDRYVDVTQGKGVARIRPEAEISYKAQPELLKNIDLQQLVQQLRTVDATLTDIEQGKTLVGQLVVGTEMYNDMRKSLAELDRGFREATNATSAIGRLLTTDQVYRQISDPLVEIDDRLGRIQAGQGQFGRLLREDGQYTQLRDQAVSLRRSIADFRAQKFMASDETYAGWNRALGALIQQVDQINTSSAFNSSLAYDNLTGSARELRNSVHDFRRDPRKFMRIKLF